MLLLQTVCHCDVKAVQSDVVTLSRRVMYLALLRMCQDGKLCLDRGLPLPLKIAEQRIHLWTIAQVEMILLLLLHQ